jgi:hypothetical protein
MATCDDRMSAAKLAQSADQMDDYVLLMSGAGDATK